MAAGHQSQVELTGSDLSIEALAAVARDPAVRVTCCAKAMKRVERCHQEIETIIGRYREAFAAGKRGDELPHVYGITTGFGEFKTIPVDPDHLGELQANILRSHATGVGDTTDRDDFGNYFPAEVVRAALVIRLNTFLKGHSGVRPEMAFFVRDMINSGVIPLVPTRGSVGSSGDLCPLAHLFVVMLEEESAGRFYVAASRDDVRRSRGEAILATRLRETMAGRLKYGGDWQIPKPSYKDGLSLTNGAAFSAAGLALAVHDAAELANVADVAAAMTLESICGRTRALDEKVHRVRNMRGQADSAANILQVLSGGKLVDLSEEVQDVYSVRCAPQVHGASRDAIAYAKMAALAEINAATDNPLFFPDETGPCDMTRGGNSTAAHPNVDGRAYSAGNFHGQPVGLAADFLAIAVAELANISERRTQMLLDKHHNRGLPASLTANPGVHSGFMIAQYCAAGLVSENKVLAHPASVDSIPTSANYEDHVAMASIAARKVRTVLSNTQSTLAIELMAAAQALDWRIQLRTSPFDGGKVSAEAFASARAAFGKGLSTGSAAALASIRGVVGPLCEDRVLAEDIRAIRMLIEDGAIRSAIESAVGALCPIVPLR
jgi:histidine ammonia-lyase